MKSFLVIGAGTFGHHLCRELCSSRCEVMVADRHAEALEDLLPLVVSAKVCDCTNLEVLRSFDAPSFDACFVCMGDSFQNCLEITDQLKELGAKKIYAVANRDLEAKFLLKNGADSIIYPERDVAARVAISESSDRIFDFIGLSEEAAISEISPHQSWIGKSISQLGFRSKYGLNVVACKNGARVTAVTDPGYVFKAEEHVLVLGSLEDIRRAT